MAAEFKFDKKDWDRALKNLGKAFEAPEKNKQLAAIIGSIVYKDIIKHFEQERGPKGKWKDWSDAYEEHMLRIGKGGNKILQDTGRMRQSFLPTNSRATKEGFVFYNNAETKGGFPYAAAHDIGGPKLPQREFMWISEQASSNMAESVSQWLVQVFGE